MSKKVATGNLTVLKSTKALEKTIAQFRIFVHNKVHIVESAIANIQQTLGYKIMLMIALKCLLYKFTYTHCTLTTKHLSHYTTSNGGRKELHKGNEKFVFRPQDSISELSLVSEMHFQSYIPIQCLRIKIPSFIFLFMSTRAHQKTRQQ